MTLLAISPTLFPNSARVVVIVRAPCVICAPFLFSGQVWLAFGMCLCRSKSAFLFRRLEGAPPVPNADLEQHRCPRSFREFVAFCLGGHRFRSIRGPAGMKTTMLRKQPLRGTEADDGHTNGSHFLGEILKLVSKSKLRKVIGPSRAVACSLAVARPQFLQHSS